MKEGFRIASEVANLKHRLWRWEVVFLQVVIETRAWAPEVRDPSSCIDGPQNVTRDFPSSPLRPPQLISTPVEMPAPVITTTLRPVRYVG